MSNIKLNPYWIFPIGFVIIETSVVIFINSASSGGHNLYNTCTSNLITEAMKLGIALYSVISSNLWDDLMKVNRATVIAFGASNLMYAFNNNLMHYSLGALPPAIFIVAINALRTILTSIFQYLVSGKSLLPRQIVACMLLVLSFLASSYSDIIDVLTNGNFSGSQFALLIFLAGLYSAISVTASLTQEKLLKDAPQIMVSNVINYSYGVVMQSIGVTYLKVVNGAPIFRGFNVWWVWLIPVLFGLSGISISFILKYFDNIIKLICSCIIVLVVHTITAYLKNESMFDFAFMICWLLTTAAVYLYNTKPEYKNENIDTKENATIWSTISSTLRSRSKFLVFVIIGCSFVGIYKINYNVRTSISNLWESDPVYPQFITNPNPDHSCTLCETPLNDYWSNLKYVETEHTTNANHKSFTYVDKSNGILFVQCPVKHKLYKLLPDYSCPDGNCPFKKWQAVSDFSRVIDAGASVNLKPKAGYHPISWNSILEYSSRSTGNISLPYVWLWCDAYKSVNLVVRPTYIKDNLKSDSKLYGQGLLSENEINEVKNYIEELSVPLAKPAVKPIDTVFIVYIDGLSRIKFNNFYKKSLGLFQKMSVDANTSHIAVQLSKLHALGYNSPPNYLALTAGIDEKFASELYFGSKRDRRAQKDSSVKREPWVFDLAEYYGYSTISGINDCHNECENNCIDNFKLSKNIEIGGFLKQYMQDTSNRAPTAHMWPMEVQCEVNSRPEIVEKVFPSTKKWPETNAMAEKRADKSISPNHNNEYWRFTMASMFNWSLDWLSSHNYHHHMRSKVSKKRFAVLVAEDQHKKDINPREDEGLSSFLEKLFFSGNQDFYNLGNAAFIFLADHGMHYTDEFDFGAGKIANKQPFAYVVLPRDYLKSNPDYAKNLYRNSNQLLSHYDLRTTVQNLISEREWSATVVKPAKFKDGKSEVFSSNVGNSILTTEIPSNRVCKDAGIPDWYCGCNLFPCKPSVVENRIEKSFKLLADYLNKRVFGDNSIAEQVCSRFTPEDFVVRSGVFDCMSAEFAVNGVTSTSITATIGITKNAGFLVVPEPMWLSVNFDVSGSVDADISAFKITNANTASTWGPQWKGCKSKFESKGLDYLKLSESNNQFCYC